MAKQFTAEDIMSMYDREEFEWGLGDYNVILKELGDITLIVDDDGYQGDCRVIFRDGKKYGWLDFGWGSCSGCDALLSCESFAEVAELANKMSEGIKWFESLDELKKYFSEKDWEGEYSYHRSEQKEFIEKVSKLQEENNGE